MSQSDPVRKRGHEPSERIKELHHADIALRPARQRSGTLTRVIYRRRLRGHRNRRGDRVRHPNHAPTTSDDFVTIELVYDPASGEVGPGNGINHLVIQVESLEETRADLATKGIEPEPIEYPGGPTGPRTCWITDPNGYRIEVVQWPDGHADGITRADFA